MPFLPSHAPERNSQFLGGRLTGFGSSPMEMLGLRNRQPPAGWIAWQLRRALKGLLGQSSTNCSPPKAR